MQYISHYSSALGDILIAADDKGIVGVWFEGQKFYAKELTEQYKEKETAEIKKCKEWLDRYFKGEDPGKCPKIHFIGTDFQIKVWNALRDIPYGTMITYGELAEKIGLARNAARAIGGAVGHNPISVLVPCHRVIGSDGSLTGYAGGLDRKMSLLALEKISR